MLRERKLREWGATATASAWVQGTGSRVPPVPPVITWSLLRKRLWL